MHKPEHDNVTEIERGRKAGSDMYLAVGVLGQPFRAKVRVLSDPKPRRCRFAGQSRPHYLVKGVDRPDVSGWVNAYFITVAVRQVRDAG